MTAMTTVGIDPGHGGSNRGCRIGGTDECDYVLKIAYYAEMAIHDLGLPIAVEHLRDTDEYIDLSGRNWRAREANCSLILSLHVNDEPRTDSGGEIVIPTLHGLQSYYWEGNPRAWLVATAIAAAAPDGLRAPAGAVLPWAAPVMDVTIRSKRDRWKRHARAIVGAYRADTVLIELGYARGDTKLLLDDQIQRLLALALAAGVRAYWEMT